MIYHHLPRIWLVLLVFRWPPSKALQRTEAHAASGLGLAMPRGAVADDLAEHEIQREHRNAVNQ